jgi:hypothetical protein
LSDELSKLDYNPWEKQKAEREKARAEREKLEVEQKKLGAEQMAAQEKANRESREAERQCAQDMSEAIVRHNRLRTDKSEQEMNVVLEGCSNGARRLHPETEEVRSARAAERLKQDVEDENQRAAAEQARIQQQNESQKKRQALEAQRDANMRRERVLIVARNCEIDNRRSIATGRAKTTSDDFTYGKGELAGISLFCIKEAQAQYGPAEFH